MDYSTPFVVKNKFQNMQKQTAWLAGEVVDDKRLLVQACQDLEHLWVQFLQERRYIRHLIEEHVLPLQKTVHTNTPRDLSCQCRVVGDFPSTTIDTFTQKESGLKCSSSQPSLKPITPKSSCDSLWEQLQSIDRKAVLSPSVKEGGGLNEAEASDEEAGLEAWEDFCSGGSGGGGSGGESKPDA